jgi:hypothetical protein
MHRARELAAGPTPGQQLIQAVATERRKPPFDEAAQPGAPFHQTNVFTRIKFISLGEAPQAHSGKWQIHARP